MSGGDYEIGKLPKWAQRLIEKLEADITYHKGRAARYQKGLLDRGEYKLEDTRDHFRVILYDDDEGKYLEIAANGNSISIEPRAANMVRARIKAG